VDWEEICTRTKAIPLVMRPSMFAAQGACDRAKSLVMYVSHTIAPVVGNVDDPTDHDQSCGALTNRRRDEFATKTR
jgi:hypothetical protein